MCLILYFVAVEKVLKGEHRFEGVLLKVDRLSGNRRPTSNEVSCSTYSMHVSRNERSFALRFMIYFMTYLTVFFWAFVCLFSFSPSGLFFFHSVLFFTACEFVCLIFRQYKVTSSHMLHSRQPNMSSLRILSDSGKKTSWSTLTPRGNYLVVTGHHTFS